MAKYPTRLTVETITHDDASRKNIPTAEYQSVMLKEEQSPIRVAYERRNRDLDPQLVWRGKDEKDWSDLVVQAPPLYIQEKVHPKVLIDDLARETREQEEAGQPRQLNLFADFNGLPTESARTEFYRHDANWSNRMILGDSLQVMASLAEREGLRGQVQCIYFDPPYGIKFNSNFQWSTTSPKVDSTDRVEEITREPEQVRAFRDTWRDGVHSYFTYLRDRMTVAQDLLSQSGCLILQIGDENVHRTRAILDEIFGDDNFVCLITVKKTHHQESNFVPSVADYLIVYAKSKAQLKYRPIRSDKSLEGIDFSKFSKTIDSQLRVEPIPSEWKDNPDLIPADRVPIRTDITLTQDGDSGNSQVPWNIFSQDCFPGTGRHWRTHEDGRRRLARAGRVAKGKTRPFYIEPWDDKPAAPHNNIWTKSLAGAQHKVYVVQTNTRIVEQALLTFSDPGDLVQRIFQQPFSWKALGVDIRGRSQTLRINYRTSHQIRMQADRLLAPELSDVDGNLEARRGTLSVFNGPKPAIAVFDTPEGEIETVGQWLSDRKREGLLAHEMGVFVRSEAELERARGAVEGAGLAFKVLDENVDTISGHVSISTMHLAKGLEFRAVVVMACDDEVIPLQERIETVADDTDLEEVYNTERHLLYVACTRARDHLLVTSVNPASEFLDDLRM